MFSFKEPLNGVINDNVSRYSETISFILKIQDHCAPRKPPSLGQCARLIRPVNIQCGVTTLQNQRFLLHPEALRHWTTPTISSLIWVYILCISTRLRPLGLNWIQHVTACRERNVLCLSLNQSRLGPLELHRSIIIYIGTHKYIFWRPMLVSVFIPWSYRTFCRSGS